MALYEDENARATLRFLVSAAGQVALRQDQVLVGGRNISGAYLYALDNGEELTADDVAKVEKALVGFVDSDLEIVSTSLHYSSALAYFDNANMRHSVALLKSRISDVVPINEMSVPSLDKKIWRIAVMRIAVMGQTLLPRTSALASCPPRLHLHGGKLLVEFGGKSRAANGDGPSAKRARSEQPCTYSTSLLRATEDLGAWGKTAGIQGIGSLNSLQHTASGRELHDFILHAEFRQESVLATLAASIKARCDAGDEQRVGVVCIAGPTSSGKTTFATKLTYYLRNLGLTGVALTVDHYYLPLDRQPKYQTRKMRSDVDYDAIESMDAALVNEHINALLEGQEVLTPVYNMKTGYRDGDGKPFQLPAPVDKSLLIIEGIHALNPNFLKSVPARRVFKVYISPLTALQVDETNALKTTDARLLRRMCRDYNFRGHSASRTLSMWSNVRRGEVRWIFPHQDAVDAVVNSSHEYEMRVLKPLVEPLLMSVPPDDPQFEKAKQLLDMLALFNPASTSKVPGTSLLREFIGDGDFDCH